LASVLITITVIPNFEGLRYGCYPQYKLAEDRAFDNINMYKLALASM